MDTGASLRGIKEIINKLRRQQSGVDYEFLERFIAKLGKMNPEILEPLVAGGQVGNIFVIRLIREWIHENRREPVIIIDGTPRAKIQFQEIASCLKYTGFERITVWFSTPEHVCLGRPDRGQREDENPEVMKRRMRDYEVNVAPLYDLMEMKTRFLEIDNSHRKVESVRSEILKFLNLTLPTDKSVEGDGIGLMQTA
jgi:adenylate kinase family enzyme